MFINVYVESDMFVFSFFYSSQMLDGGCRVNKLMILKENYVLTGNKVFFPSINPRIIIVLAPLEQ